MTSTSTRSGFCRQGPFSPGLLCEEGRKRKKEKMEEGGRRKKHAKW